MLTVLGLGAYSLGLKVLGLGLDGWGRDYITEVDGQWQLNQDHPQLCWPLVRVQLKPVFSLANNSYIRMTVITSQSVETLTELCRKRHPLWFPQTPASAGHTLHHLDNTEYCVCIIFGLNSTMTALHAARIHVYDVCMYIHHIHVLTTANNHSQLLHTQQFNKLLHHQHFYRVRAILCTVWTMLSQDIRLSVHHTPLFYKNG